jgi:hypothetical protein
VIYQFKFLEKNILMLKNLIPLVEKYSNSKHWLSRVLTEQQYKALKSFNRIIQHVRWNIDWFNFDTKYSLLSPKTDIAKTDILPNFSFLIIQHLNSIQVNIEWIMTRYIKTCILLLSLFIISPIILHKK